MGNHRTWRSRRNIRLGPTQLPDNRKLLVLSMAQQYHHLVETKRKRLVDGKGHVRRLDKITFVLFSSHANLCNFDSLHQQLLRRRWWLIGTPQLARRLPRRELSKVLMAGICSPPTT